MIINKSINAFKEAKEVIPGGVDSPVRAFNSVGGVPRFIARGDGAYIEDIDGNRYVDFIQSWGPLIFGQNDEEIKQNVIRSIDNGLSFGAPTESETLLAKEILKHYRYIDKIRFVSSGTEAVMSAIRLARGYKNRDDIVKFIGCYHGHSDSLLVEAGSGAATFATPSSPGVPADLTKHTLLARYNDIKSVEECFKQSNNIAAVIIEPIAGNMGFVPADKEFLQNLREICDKYDALLIFDEVMSGFRACSDGAFAIYDVKPDIVTLGKVIGGGMPVGAFGANKDIMSKLSPDGPIYQAGTLSGNPVAMAAGLASIRRVNQDLIKSLHVKALKLTQGIKRMADKHDIDISVNTIGSMFGFFFYKNEVKNFDDALKSNSDMFAKFHAGMLEEGYYFACSQFETGFISTAVTDDIIDNTIKAVDKVFGYISGK